jgi:hypothetical protein
MQKNVSYAIYSSVQDTNWHRSLAHMLPLYPARQLPENFFCMLHVITCNTVTLHYREKDAIDLDKVYKKKLWGISQDSIYVYFRNSFSSFLFLLISPLISSS